jgi:hypothetical protein
MLTMLGMILLGFAGFSAAFILFVFLFGDKGTFLSLTKTGTQAGYPIVTFPNTWTATHSSSTSAGDIHDLQLTTIGMIFVYGGMFATLLLAVMMFMAPWSILNKCRVCAACTCPEPACPPTCGGGCAV